MTGVAVPLLLALLQLEEMDILEHEPNEQHEALEEEELDDIDPDTGSAAFDFTGTDPQVLGNHNAPALSSSCV